MDHHPGPARRRLLDLESASHELGALGGHWVGVELSHPDGSGPFLTLTGRLGPSRLLGGFPRRSLAVVVGEATLRVSERAFARGVLETYRDERAALEWRLVAVELRIGVLVEIEEIPAGRPR